MDELELLKEFRATRPGLDGRTEERIRQRVFLAIEATVDKAVDEVTVAATDLPEAVRADGGPSEYAVPVLLAPPRRRRWQRWLVAAVSLLLLAFGSVIARRGGNTSTASSTPSSSPASIEQVATAAASAPDRPLQPGQYAFVRVVEGQLEEPQSRPPTVTEYDVELWLDDDNAGVESRQQRGSSSAPTSWRTIPVGRGGFGTSTYQRLRELPADHNLIGERLLRDASIAADEANQVPGLIERALPWPSLPPAARRAAIEVLAARGRQVGMVTDHSGRDGLGIAVATPDATQTVFVLEPATGALLGTFSVPEGAALDRHHAVRWYTVKEAGIRDRLPT